MVSIDHLDTAVGMDVRLIALDLADRSIMSACLRDDLAVIAERFPNAPIALLSSTDDRLMESQALEMGIRGFFTTSLPIDIAIAGLRLVLAGGVFCPHPLGGLVVNTAASPKPIEAPKPQEENRKTNGRAYDISMADFTPREADVLAELQSGSSNKVIAGRLNLSGHTVKMHLQHIMRKLQVQNRTEVVARLVRRAPDGRDAAAT
jgi:DNA-binding NarL/FixJ family response regulator